MRSINRIAILIALAAAACGKGSPTAPTPTPMSTSAKVITLSGNLAFGNLPVGTTAEASLRISNSGSTAMTVTALTGPSGFTAGWMSGSIPAGGSQDVMVRFSPTLEQFYSGTLTVSADQTSGTNTIAISGTGTGTGGVALTGVVTAGGTGVPISGATITVIDGPDAGRIATTSISGAYRFDHLAIGNANLSVRGSGYLGTASGVYVDGTNALNFALQVDRGPLWSNSGVGDSVFTMPTTVSRVRITAQYTGYGSGFIVQINGKRIVNEIMGTGWNLTSFEGTYDTTGGSVNIYYSGDVAWWFTEVR